MHWLGYSTCAGNVRAGAGSTCAGNVCASATALPRPSGRGSPLRSGCGLDGRCGAMRPPQGAHVPIASPSVALLRGAGGDCALLGGRASLGACWAVFGTCILALCSMHASLANGPRMCGRLAQAPSSACAARQAPVRKVAAGRAQRIALRAARLSSCVRRVRLVVVGFLVGLSVPGP